MMRTYFLFSLPSDPVAVIALLVVLWICGWMITTRAKRQKQNKLEAELREQLRRRDISANDAFANWEAEERRKNLG